MRRSASGSRLILVDNLPFDFAFLVRGEADIEIFGVGDFPERFEKRVCKDSRFDASSLTVISASSPEFLPLFEIDVNYERDAQ